MFSMIEGILYLLADWGFLLGVQLDNSHQELVPSKKNLQNALLTEGVVTFFYSTDQP
jgi:hypothetical protein